MNKPRYFSDIPDDGFELHETEAEARARVQFFIDDMRGEGEWHEEMESAYWGVILGAVREKPGSRLSVEEMVGLEGYEGQEAVEYACRSGFDYVCDYETIRHDPAGEGT